MATISNTGVSYVISAKDQSKAAVNSATTGAKRVGTATERMAAKTKLHLANMRKYWVAASAAIVAVGYLAQREVSKAIQYASDLQETTGKFNVVFKDQIKQAEAWSATLRDSYAMSTRESKAYLSSIQDLLVPMGMASSQAGHLSFEVVKLAADLGSFNNLPTEKVMLDIQSALVGNFETMKKYGVVLNAQVVQEEALAMGLADTKDALTAADKAQAAYSLMVKGSTAAIDDMARTSDSYANQQKKLKALLEDTYVILGNRLLPKITEFVKEANDWLSVNQALISQKIDTYLRRVADAAVFVRDGVTGIAATFNAMAAGALSAYAGVLKLGQGFAWLKSKVGIGEEKRAQYAAVFEEMKIEAEAAMAAATALAEKSQAPFLGSQGNAGPGPEERAQALREELETRNEIYRQANEALAQQSDEISQADGTDTAEVELLALEERLLARNALYYQFNEELAYGEMETQAQKLARQASYYAMDQEAYEKCQANKLKTALAAAKAETEIKKAVLNNIIALLQTLGAENEAAAVLGIAISTAAEMVRAYQATMSAATLAYASQLIPGDPTSIARATAAAAATKAWGMANVALIGAIGALRIGQTLSGGGSEGVNYTSDYSSSTGEIETEADTDTEESTERSISVNVNVYGNMVGDYDSLARDLVASIRKAEADGV